MSRERITRNFYRDEFACRCGCGFDAVDVRLVEGLQRLRDIMQAPIHINSGCRCAAHNASVGGAPKSQHLLGKAADVRVDGNTPSDVADFAKLLCEFGNSGIIIYDTFTHLDVRRGRYREDKRGRR